MKWVVSTEPKLEHKHVSKNVLLGQAIKMALTILFTITTQYQDSLSLWLFSILLFRSKCSYKDIFPRRRLDEIDKKQGSKRPLKPTIIYESKKNSERMITVSS